MISEYREAAGIPTDRKDTPLFRTAYGKTGQLTKNALHVIDICRMLKRRLKDAGLSVRPSPHSFRVTTITDLLEQGVALEDVLRLTGHADPHYPPLRPPRKEDYPQHRGANFDLISPRRWQRRLCACVQSTRAPRALPPQPQNSRYDNPCHDSRFSDLRLCSCLPVQR